MPWMAIASSGTAVTTVRLGELETAGQVVSGHKFTFLNFSRF